MSGPQTLGLCWGGETPSLTTATESFDGTSWTTSPATLGTAVKNQGGNKDNTSGTSALSVYGNTPSDTSAAEEYNASVNTITSAAFSAGGNLNTARGEASGGGSQTAGIMVGGGTPNKTNVENYDGSSWSEGPDISNARRNAGGTDAGTQSAFAIFGGYESALSNKTEEWNGSSWTAGGPLNSP